MDAGLLLETLPAVPNQPRQTAAKQMSDRKWRELLGRYIYGTKETESMEKIRPYLFWLKGRKSRHQFQINGEY